MQVLLNIFNRLLDKKNLNGWRELHEVHVHINLHADNVSIF